MLSVAVRLLLGWMTVLLLAACGSTKPVVKIGLVAPFEGRHRDVGYDAIYSARLAVREINSAGGIDGSRVALVALDDRGDPTLAREAAASLVVDPAVIAVVGHFLPETTTAAQPVYESAGLPLIVTGAPPFAATNPALLTTAFREAYAEVSPLGEQAGPYAGPTYDALTMLWQALADAEESGGGISRDTVRASLGRLEYEAVPAGHDAP